MRNQETMLVASLATDIADPIERMLAIKASMQVGKGAVADTGALRDDIVAGWLELKEAAMPQVEKRFRSSRRARTGLLGR